MTVFNDENPRHTEEGVSADSLEGLILRVKWLEADIKRLQEQLNLHTGNKIAK